MKYGMPTLVELNGLEECAALAAELHLDFVEFNQSFPQYQSPDSAALRSLAERYGIFFTVHLDEMLNPFDFNDRIAEAYLENALDSIRLAKAAGICRLNLHLQYGVYVTLPEKRIFLNDVYAEDYARRVLRFRDRCSEEIGDADLKICIENTDLPFLSCHHHAIDLLLQSPCFALTLDTGHDQASRHVDLPFFKAHTDRLKHLHLHNCKGTSPHLPLGEGDVDVAGMIALAEQCDAACLIEVKTVDGLRKSVSWLKEHGYYEKEA